MLPDLALTLVIYTFCGCSMTSFTLLSSITESISAYSIPLQYSHSPSPSRTTIPSSLWLYIYSSKNVSISSSYCIHLTNSCVLSESLYKLFTLSFCIKYSYVLTLVCTKSSTLSAVLLTVSLLISVNITATIVNNINPVIIEIKNALTSDMPHILLLSSISSPILPY